MPPEKSKTIATGKSTEFSSYLTFKFDLIKTELIRRANIVYRRELGLDVRALRVLRVICDVPGITSTEVIVFTLIEKTLLSKVVAELIERNLIRRTIHPEDARRTQLWPTPSGSRTRATSDTLGLALEKDMLSVLAPSERIDLNRIVDKLANSLRVMGDIEST
jgi:DNA-binding MarR family transcriptional regulator